jgi:hypothetical protein
VCGRFDAGPVAGWVIADLQGRGLLPMRGGDGARLQRRGLQLTRTRMKLSLCRDGRVIHTARCMCRSSWTPRCCGRSSNACEGMHAQWTDLYSLRPH